MRPIVRSHRRRLFFALWPDEAWRQGLLQAVQSALRSAGGGRAVPPSDWHVTLCFLGSVEEPVLQPLQRQVDRLQAAAFALRFDRLCHWRQAGVLAALADCPPAAVQLAGALRGVSRELGLAPDDKPLRPHITLVRGLTGAHGGGPREEPLELTLTAAEFHLAESREGVVAPAARYGSLGRWPLAG